MNAFKRGMVFLTFFGCCFALVLMAAAFGTEFWYVAKCFQADLNSNGTSFIQSASGNIHFGLLKGVKTLNWGIGDRVEVIDVKSTFLPHILSRGLWISTIATLSGSLLFTVVAAIFAIVNAVTTPIECITGLPGLYLWNILAALCGVACIVCWGVQFGLKLTSNVLIEEAEDGWTTEDFQSLGYSFWLVVVSIGIHVANCTVIRIATKEKSVRTRYEMPDAKSGNIMLY